MRRSGIFKRMRRGESGQSLVIIALGFVALLGFVGLVTDVSLMFVRYSTLMRAVDSASIAAAGQVRRLLLRGVLGRTLTLAPGLKPQPLPGASPIVVWQPVSLSNFTA
jgi:hypothetical protein